MLLDRMRNSPPTEIAAGVAAALAGAGLVATGPVVITAGASLCAIGAGLIMGGVVLAGIGTVLFVLGESALAVRGSIASGIALGTAGVVVTAVGMVVKGIGYCCIGGGVVLLIGGAYLAARGIRRIRDPKQREIAEAARRTIEELKARHLGQGLEREPVVIIDMQEVHQR